MIFMSVALPGKYQSCDVLAFGLLMCQIVKDRTLKVLATYETAGVPLRIVGVYCRFLEGD